VTLGDAAFLLAAGVLAGLTGTIAGMASLVSYPALLAVGLPPVVANVTNTVALCGNTIGAMTGARPELVGQGALIRKYLPLMALGGISGATLLLFTPSSGFEYVVPFLVLGSAILILARPALQRRALAAHAADEAAGIEPSREVWPWIALALIAVYGGYFGAGAGTMVTALLALLIEDSLARITALRIVLMGAINSISAIEFAFSGYVRWLYALPLGLGFIGGGYVSPWIIRRISTELLRVIIAVCGFLLAIDLAAQAYL
jgi:uncharacterized membrane protein YfcA